MALLEAREDIGEGTSKANTAILHTGFDAKPGTVEPRMVHDGYNLLKAYAKHTGIPIEPTGAILVAWNAEELAALPALKEKAEANDYHDCEIVSADAVYAAVPALGEGALGGLTCRASRSSAPGPPTWPSPPTPSSAVSPYSPITPLPPSQLPRTRRCCTPPVERSVTRWVINAAGLGADSIDAMFGYARFTVVPCGVASCSCSTNAPGHW